MTLLIGEDVNLTRGIFLVEEMSRFLVTGQDSLPHPRVSYKGRLKERGDSPHRVRVTMQH